MCAWRAMSTIDHTSTWQPGFSLLRLRLCWSAGCGSNMTSMGTRVAVVLLLSGVLAPGERLPVKTYTSADGLPHDRVPALLSDSHGYLWFGTEEGLGRFDGSRFVSYGVERGLPDRTVNDLIEARDGSYWIATEGAGVCRFRPWESKAAFTVFRIGNTKAANFVNSIREDGHGRIWAGTNDGLYWREAEGALQRHHAVSGPVLSVLRDKLGLLWAGGASGIYRLIPDARPRKTPGRFGTSWPVSKIVTAGCGLAAVTA